MNLFDRFFLWCSDTDINTLNIVDTQDKRSKKYQINYGKLVLIPTIMSTFGIIHAMTDFTDNLFFCCIVGIILGIFIFTIDKAIIATYEKNENRIGKQFWSRLILSILMGFVIALFFLFYFFQNRINDQIKTDLFNKNILTNKQFDKQKESIESHYNERIKFKDFLNEVTQAELDGGKSKTFFYKNISYTTTGNRGRSISTINRENTIKELEKYIDSVKSDIKPRLDENEQSRKYQLQLNNNYAKNKDPLIKLEMLIKVVKLHPLLLIIIIPLYLFLLILDIIPILIKELAKSTKYDNLYRNSKLSEVNLDLTEYNKKTQEIFDKDYNKNPPLTISFLNKNIVKKFEEVKNEVKNLNWRAISILGILCGIGIYIYQVLFEITLTDLSNGKILLLISIVTNFIFWGMQKIIERFHVMLNKNNQKIE